MKSDLFLEQLTKILIRQATSTAFNSECEPEEERVQAPATINISKNTEKHGNSGDRFNKQLS
jgi:hypothetical protein